MSALRFGSEGCISPQHSARVLKLSALTFALAHALAGSPAHAQDAGPIGSLGGYGVMAGVPGAAMGAVVDPSGMGAGAMAPFGGRIGVMMPSGMGRGGGLSFGERSSAMMSSNRPSFTISPMSGMRAMSSGDRGFTRRPFVLRPLAPLGGIGTGDGIERMAGSRGMGVMPPNFGYPFRQPPSLLSGSTSGAGMSM